jgi:5-methylcytosine-specific restriction endonuclease McrA
MIRVQRVPEPESFHEKVRVPGENALAELVGEKTPTRRGRPRKAVAKTRDQLPPASIRKNDYWTQCLPELREAYRHCCAYLGLYISPATGAATVDHFIPISCKTDSCKEKGKLSNWEGAYEWDNYRLAARDINTNKSNHVLEVDPFALEANRFQLNFVSFEVVPDPTLAPGTWETTKKTITLLKLNDPRYCDAREEHAHEYWKQEITFHQLERRAPFVAKELARQDKWKEGFPKRR